MSIPQLLLLSEQRLYRRIPHIGTSMGHLQTRTAATTLKQARIHLSATSRICRSQTAVGGRARSASLQPCAFTPLVSISPVLIARFIHAARYLRSSSTSSMPTQHAYAPSSPLYQVRSRFPDFLRCPCRGPHHSHPSSPSFPSSLAPFSQVTLQVLEIEDVSVRSPVSVPARPPRQARASGRHPTRCVHGPLRPELHLAPHTSAASDYSVPAQGRTQNTTLRTMAMMMTCSTLAQMRTS